MKVKDLVQELEERVEYIEFKEKNRNSFFTAAFLILNLENRSEQIQLDYFIPSENEIAAFSYPFSEPKIHDEIISVNESGKTEGVSPKPMVEQVIDIRIDIDDLEPKCKELIEKNNSSIKPTKIIAILKDNIWNLTCMDNMLGIIRLKIDAVSEEVLHFDKGGLMDFMGIRKK